MQQIRNPLRVSLLVMVRFNPFFEYDTADAVLMSTVYSDESVPTFTLNTATSFSFSFK